MPEISFSTFLINYFTNLLNNLQLEHFGGTNGTPTLIRCGQEFKDLNAA